MHKLIGCPPPIVPLRPNSNLYIVPLDSAEESIMLGNVLPLPSFTCNPPPFE